LVAERRPSEARSEWSDQAPKVAAHPHLLFLVCSCDENLTPQRRFSLVRALVDGLSQRATARRFRVSLATVQYWAARAAQAPIASALDCASRRRGPKRCPNRTALEVEQQVLDWRQQLAKGPLGEIGARAIHAAWQAAHLQTALPSLRTIGRILARSGVLDGQIRCRRPAPRPGWYLPRVADRQAELDSFDGVEGLVIAGGQRVEVFNAISLLGGLPGSWPHPVLRTDQVLADLTAHWRQHGLPSYAQFDNDTLFQGAHHYTDAVGRVMRLCLQLEIIPVFAPPRETGFQAAIENYNGRWQTKVWNRFVHRDLAQLQARSVAYVEALRTRSAQRIERAPDRRLWPVSFHFQPTAPPQGQLIYLRRTDPSGHALVLGHRFPVDPAWPLRLVRAEVCLTRGLIEFYALRRRDPDHHPFLKAHPYRFPVAGEKRSYAPRDKAHLSFQNRSLPT
jgi:transposase